MKLRSLIESFRKAKIPSAPVDSWVVTKSAFWSALEAKQVSIAFDLAAKLESLAINESQKAERGEIWWQVGKWGVWQSHLEIAEKALLKTVSFCPFHLEAWNELVNTYYYLGNLDQAEATALSMQSARVEVAKARGIDIDEAIIFPTRWIVSIGHNAALAWWVKAKILGIVPDVKLKLVNVPAKIANAELFSLLAPYFEIISDKNEIAKIEADSLIYQDSPFLMRTKHGYKSAFRSIPLIESSWEADARKALLSLSEVQIQSCQETLRHFGIDPLKPHVCLHVREAASHFQSDDDHAQLRNAEIKDYELAIKEITKNGLNVFRMGDVRMSKLNPSDFVIDYAHSEFKSPEMDIYLFATCRFMISTPSGPAVIPRLFGKRTLHTNWSPLGNIHPFPGDIFLPRRVWSTATKRLLSIGEILSLPIGWGESRSVLEISSCQLEANSPTEILGAVRDMIAAIEGEYNLSANTELQNEFSKRGFCYVPPIAPSFSFLGAQNGI